MKKIIFPALFSLAVLLACNNVPEGSTSTTFKVWGNCGMCKKTIETSLKQEGITKAEWDKDSKMMEVVYDPKKISIEQIHASIAGVGYDTEQQRGSDSAYANLHECCRYERK